MSESSSVLQDLIALTRSLGDPARDLAILGEGNTSALLDESTFLVKASGKEMRTADEGSFVPVSLPRALAVLNGPNLTDSETRAALMACKAAGEPTAAEELRSRGAEELNSSPYPGSGLGALGVLAVAPPLAPNAQRPTPPLVPSVETFLHAYLLSLPGIRFVGHTHPTAVNAILCSVQSRQAVSGRLFPDEIVCCGPAVCYVEYTDPGIPLARRLRECVEEFIDEHNMAPKVILMENHGFIATGKTVRDVEAATAMYVKTARVLVGAYALGGPRFMSAANVARIHTRPDEHYRQKQIGG